jgi:DNA adenine methylase
MISNSPPRTSKKKNKRTQSTKNTAVQVNFLAKNPMRAPVAWYGGKAYYAKWILEMFPEHRVFVEPYGGAGNILLRKQHSEVEVFNDLDARIVNFFSVLRKPSTFKTLQRLVSLTPYSRAAFKELATTPEPSGAVERAWWFFVRCRQAIGGLGMSELSPASWSTSIRTRRNMAEPVSKYLSSIDGLPDVAERFRTVLLECSPASELIKKYDGEDVFFYCDPPYVPETRHGKKAKTYGKEMTYEDHEELLDVLLKCQGKVMLSGYPSVLYDTALSSWRREEYITKAHMANSGQKRIEVLWMNW